MKIIMLGHSGVGKTTYMASMYGTLQSAINGFSLKAQNTTDHQDLQMVYTDICRNRYPAGTKHRAQYNFSLLYHGRSYFPFEWVDYRGKALTVRSDDEEAQQLIKDLREADGIIMFCAADVMAGVNAARQVGRMMTHVGRALNGEDKPRVVAIVFTKSDLVDELDDDLVRPISGLLEAISKSKTTIGTIIPVACGSRLVNTELPVLFALHYGIRFQALQLTTELKYWREKKEYWDREGESLIGLFKNIGRSITGESTSYERARQAYQQAQNKMNAIQQLVDPAKGLETYLKDLQVV